MVSRQIQTLPNGRQATVVTIRDNFSAPGINTSQEKWDEIFGARQKKENYRSRSVYTKEGKVEEEWWTHDGKQYYRKSINGTEIAAGTIDCRGILCPL